VCIYPFYLPLNKVRTLEGAINMSDFDNEDEAITENVLDPNIRRQLREAEKARKELDVARAELEAQKRDLQFTKAGIPETGVGALLRKAYDGPADAESIAKAAQEYGILQSPQTPAEAPVTNDVELEALRRAQGATIGTSGAGPDLGQEFMARLSEASNPEDVMKIVMTPEYEQALQVWTSRSAR
jgi:hypothetical protein